MRNAFAAELTALGKADERIVLLSADIGNRLFDKFKDACPGRFFNCGVAEANTVGIAAGLALAGFRPVTYTIASFMTGRSYEQIKLDVAYHDLPVVIVGVGAGLAYAGDGPTHHSCDDLSLMCGLPGMTVLAPADPEETKLALREAFARSGPVYIRLGKKGEAAIAPSPPDHSIFRARELRPGLDVCILSTGVMARECLTAAEQLSRNGVAARVVHMPCVKPLDTGFLDSLAFESRLLVVVEEHSLHGGLGSMVAQYLGGKRPQPRLLCCGVDDFFLCEAGGQAHARVRHGLDAVSLAERVAAAWKSLQPGDL